MVAISRLELTLQGQALVPTMTRSQVLVLKSPSNVEASYAKLYALKLVCWDMCNSRIVRTDLGEYVLQTYEKMGWLP